MGTDEWLRFMCESRDSSPDIEKIRSQDRRVAIGYGFNSPVNGRDGKRFHFMSPLNFIHKHIVG